MDILNSQFVSGWLTVFAFVINKTKATLDETIIKVIAEKLQELVDQEPTKEDVVDGVFDIFDWVAEQTKTPVDDLIVDAVKSLFGGNVLMKDQFRFRHFIKMIFRLVVARKKIRGKKKRRNG